MKELLTYIFGSAVCAGVLAAFYSLLLERRVRFGLCRAFLLVSVLLAGVIPVLKIPVWRGETIHLEAMPRISAGEITAEVVQSPGETFTVLHLLAVLYAAGAAIMAAMAVRQLLKMRQMRREGEMLVVEGLRVVMVPQEISSFSFFGIVYASTGTPPEDLPLIVAHEAVHIRRRHSAERVAMEIAKTVLWWNPFVWILACRLTEVHEYEADSEVLAGGCDVSNYVDTLLKHLWGYSPDIANGLRDSLTKKRLKMMTVKRSGRYVLLRMLAAIPVIGGLMTLFSFTSRAARIEISERHEAVVESVAEEDTPVEKTVSSAITRIEEHNGNPLLVVVDGELFCTPDNFGEAMKGLDAEDIASITIIKEDNGKAAYAHLGDVSNGVMVISTHGGPLAPFSGTVTDFDGKPIQGAIVEVVGTKRGTVTDIDGRFTLRDVPDAATVRVSFIGYESAMVVADNPQSNIRIFLEREDMPAAESEVKTETSGLSGGFDLEEFHQWAMTRIRYPEEALKEGLAGRVEVSFVVDTEGRVGDIEVLSSPSAIFSEEVVRVLKLSPVWTPYEEEGRKVAVKFSMPISFAYKTDEGLVRGETSEIPAGYIDELMVIRFR